ncbi:MAG: flagellar motor protein MotB [Deltaproteobacteria bacterium]|nr:flagellar motor protein MotB [Candidatus Anaeroferrophillus wilburensis]
MSGRNNAWMVTLSDLLVLMLTFFVLLISMSSMDKKTFKKMFGVLPASLGVLHLGGGTPSVDRKETLIVPSTLSPRAITDLAALRKLSPALSRLLDDLETQAPPDSLVVKAVNDDLELEVAADFLFGTLDATLKKAGRPFLALLAAFIADQSDPLLIEVYTDNFPLHTAAFPDNWVLAAVRGHVIASQLRQQGIKEDRMSLAAFGPDRPLVANDTPEHRSRNRRIVMKLSGWVSRLNPPAENSDS